MKNVLAPAVLLLTVLAGCAKEKPYDEVNKTADLLSPEFIQSKQRMLDMCSAQDPCLYLPSVGNSPYAVTASRPFSQGEQKLVVTKITKDKLQFLELDPDKRYQDNENNKSPVFNLSIQHLDYKCKEDDFGDCTNKEEVDDDKHWSARRQIKIDDVEVVELNSLPLDFANIVGKGCLSEIDKEIKSLKVENDSLNVSVKKTYKGSADCVGIDSFDEVRYLRFSIDYKYSVVKLSSLTDKSYTAVDYPQEDQNVFGFFKSDIKKKTVDNYDHVTGVRKSFLNRWSPNKKEVIYYLNSEFYKPGKEVVLAATIQAIDSVNRSLRKAKANLQIVLKKGDDSEIGNLKKNFIVLVHDPQASGVIGYGPSVANPKTGEIVNARTIMFYGTIQKFVGRAYDELAEELTKNYSGTMQVSSSLGNVKTKVADNSAMQFGHSADASIDIDDSGLMRMVGRLQQDLNAAGNAPNVFVSEQDSEKAFKKFIKETSSNSFSFEQKIAKMAEKTFFHASHFNFDDAVIKALKKKLQASKDKTLAKWDDLTEKERAEMMKHLVPYVWEPTLVHEFGHNLGLRHNFKGSFDKANYYVSSEREAMGLKRDVTYSSIMDYAPHTNNELKVMGKYDIAALRFAYAREVELSNGAHVLLESTLVEKSKELVSMSTDSAESVTLKPYAYCTDEHVASDLLCNRFDDGDSYEKVVSGYIESYKKNYDKLHHRGRRYSFDGLYGDYNYLNRVFGTFSQIQQFFERYDRVAQGREYEEALAKMNSEGQKQDFIQLKQAVDKSFEFFKEVLEVPAYHCAILDAKTKTVKQVMPFVQLVKNFDYVTDFKNGCKLFALGLPEGTVMGEFGTYFNNAWDINQDRSQIVAGDPTQIDIRGNWMDKVLAGYLLSKRNYTPSTVGAVSAGNYLDYQEYRKDIMKVLDEMFQDSIQREVTIKTYKYDVLKTEVVDGDSFPAQVTFGVEDSQNINRSFHPAVNGIMGLFSPQTNIKTTLMRFVKSGLINTADITNVENEEALDVYLKFDVDKVSTRINLDRYNYDKIVEFKSKSGAVNHRFGIYNYNDKAMKLAQFKEGLDIVGTLTLADENKGESIYFAKAILENPQITLDAVRSGGALDEAKIKNTVHVVEELYLKGMTEVASLNMKQWGLVKEALLNSTLDSLIAVVDEESKEKVFTPEQIFACKVYLASKLEFSAGFLNGTLTEQVLLSSFIALSK